MKLSSEIAVTEPPRVSPARKPASHPALHPSLQPHQVRSSASKASALEENPKKEVSPTAKWPPPKRRAPEAAKRTITARRRSASLSNSLPTVKIQGMDSITPAIPTQNRFGILAKCKINTEKTNPSSRDTLTKDAPQKPNTIDPPTTKPPPIYIHGELDYHIFLDAIKDRYDSRYQVKFTSNKLKINFYNIPDFNDFKELCRAENIQYHTYSIQTERPITVALKGLIKLPAKIITNNLKSQGLNPLNCVELPTSTRYPIYRVTFAPGTTIAKINHTRFIENVKVYWEKFETRRPIVQCYRCQAHGHTSANCNKTPACVKCAGPHDTRTCTKTQETTPTCVNCKGPHPANYTKCPALLSFLTKRNQHKIQQKSTAPRQPPPHPPTPTQLAYPALSKVSAKPHPPLQANSLHTESPCFQNTYANMVARKPSPPTTPLPPQTNSITNLEDIKISGLELFMRIIDLIRKHYINCTNNLDRVMATARIVAELDAGN